MSDYDFDFRQLEVFCKVVDLGSFSKAAKEVYLAQATVSERIANLEKRVGVRLLDRLGRKISPTRAGEIFYRQAGKLLEMKKLARMEMEEYLGLQKGVVKIGGSTIPGEYILPRLLGKFQEEHPQVSIDLTVADSREIEALVSAGGLEIGVIGYQDVAPGLDRYELWEDELVLVVPGNHPWAGLESVSWPELARQPFIVRERGSGTLKIMEEYLTRAGISSLEELSVAARLGSSTAVKEGIKAGLGVSILSVRAVSTEVRLGLLKAIRLTGPRLTRHFHLIQDNRRSASPLCRALLDFFLEEAR
ncbi:MAG: LysR family transcriptional regulator [Desulfohalobiaceae bacterium]|nr:LysR family transcriptional regulator [Desulfohalobiaceae bacterium]